jgi:hypothetical protein
MHLRVDGSSDPGILLAKKSCSLLEFTSYNKN